MYDLTIIGAGVSNVFLAYTIQRKNPDVSVIVIDKGKPVVERLCGFMYL